MFVVPTIRFQVLYIFIILGLERRRLIFANVTTNPTAERLIGTLRRECFDHLIVLSERHAQRLLAEFRDWYNLDRLHLALEKGCARPPPK
jgi:transposase InsO family protein